MVEGIRIDELPPTAVGAQLDHVVPVMRDGLTNRLTLAQILTLGRIATALADGTDLDTITSGGVYVVTSDVNAPVSGGRWIVRVTVDPSSAGTLLQEAYLLTGSSGALAFTRISAAGVFGAWSGGLSAADISFDDSNAFPGARNVQEALEAAADPWASLPLRVPIPVFDHLGGGAPPTDKWYRYVKLSAGETGAGGYNEGILANESVSGSAPLITATAVVSLSDSPLYGQTIHLIGTERRFIRAGLAGAVQDDALQDHAHHIINFNPGTFGGSSGSQCLRSDGPSPGYLASTVASGGRVSTETRPRNVGATFYMRIK